MRWAVVLSCAAALLSSVAAWDKGDHELFQLNDAVKANEGLNVTFYDFIGVSPKATQDQIRRAYHKKAARIHPDKAQHSFVANYGKPKKGDKAKVHKKPSKRELDAFSKEANERFKRLSVVATVLRGDQRERYDYFLQNGFPAWRGTGYYYSRYRPGLGTVVIGLLIFGGGFVHYGVMQLTYKRQRDFMERYIKYARRMAWGNDMGLAGIPGLDAATNPSTGFESANGGGGDDPQATNLNRRQKRMQAKEDKKLAKKPKPTRSPGTHTPAEAEAKARSGPQGAKKRVVAENGKVLIVDSIGNVYLEEEDEDGQVHELLLDLGEIPRPSFGNTFLVRMPIWAYHKSIDRILGGRVQASTLDEDEPEQEGEEEEEESERASTPNQNGAARKARAGAR